MTDVRNVKGWRIERSKWELNPLEARNHSQYLVLATATKSFQDLDAGMAPGLTTANARANGVLKGIGYGEE
jgi:hypothetical protein